MTWPQRRLCCVGLRWKLKGWDHLISLFGTWLKNQSIWNYPELLYARNKWIITLRPFVGAEFFMQRVVDLGGGRRVPDPRTDNVYAWWLRDLSMLEQLNLRPRNPRDCVFILRNFTPWFEHVYVRYDAPVEAVFAEATISFLQSAGHWSLRHWQCPAVSPYLPSWVMTSPITTQRIRRIRMGDLPNT